MSLGSSIYIISKVVEHIFGVILLHFLVLKKIKICECIFFSTPLLRSPLKYAIFTEGPLLGPGTLKCSELAESSYKSRFSLLYEFFLAFSSMCRGSGLYNTIFVNQREVDEA